MKRTAIFIILIISGLVIDAQAQRVYKNLIGQFVIDASGLPATHIKSKNEVIDSKEQPSGITKRHTSRKGNGTNPNVNYKVSPKFAVSNQDVTTFNNTTGEYQEAAHWMEASGWEASTADNNLNESAEAVLRGCAAYKGDDGTDSNGSWRLPTARELNLIWAMYNKLLALGYTPLKSGYYWSSSEADNSRGYVLTFPQGSFLDPQKWNTGRMRCVKDL